MCRGRTHTKKEVVTKITYLLSAAKVGVNQILKK